MNSEEYLASLLPYALYDGGITNLRAEHTESVWSVRFWYIVVLGGGMAMFTVTEYSWILKYIYNDYIK